MIRTAKRMFEKKLAAGGDGNKRPIFAEAKEKTKSRTPMVGPMKDAQGVMILGEVEMASLLNDTFKSVFMREDGNEGLDILPMPVPDQLKTVKFSAKRKREKISNLPTEAAPRPDWIGLMLLKELSANLIPALVIIFTKSRRVDKCQQAGRMLM
jgi:hypothetical protein